MDFYRPLVLDKWLRKKFDPPVHAKNYLIIWCLKPLTGSSKFGPSFPVEYNYPKKQLLSNPPTPKHRFHTLFLLQSNLSNFGEVFRVSNLYGVAQYGATYVNLGRSSHTCDSTAGSRKILFIKPVCRSTVFANHCC